MQPYVIYDNLNNEIYVIKQTIYGEEIDIEMQSEHITFILSMNEYIRVLNNRNLTILGNL